MNQWLEDVPYKTVARVGGSRAGHRKLAGPALRWPEKPFLELSFGK